MAGKQHHYDVKIIWTGNLGPGTIGPAGYSRAHLIHTEGKPDIAGSSDPAFRGDPSRWNPEVLLLAAISSCHKLWYLGLCAETGIIVMAYEDHAEGVMAEQADGTGQFTSVTLHPHVTIAAGSDRDVALALHAKAHEMCFIARSVNFPVHHAPVIQVMPTDIPRQDPR